MENMVELYSELANKALEIRKNIIKMIYMASSGHPGGALSLVEILTVLYFYEMKNISFDIKDERSR